MTFTREEHLEMEGVAPFELPEEVGLPSGRHLKGSKARSYHLLKRTALEQMRHRIGAEIGPPGWVPGYYLCRAWSGGKAGDRRVRDLRALGVGIEMMEFESRTHGATRTFLYRWISDPPSREASQVAQETRPEERNGFMGRFQTESRIPQPGMGIEAHGALRFWTSVGSPGDGAPRVSINPFKAPGHPVAVPLPLFARRVNGLGLEEALEDYRETLRARWVDRSLRRFVEAGGEVLFWVTPEHSETMNVLPALAAALTHCGATHLGEFSGRRVA